MTTAQKPARALPTRTRQGTVGPGPVIRKEAAPQNGMQPYTVTGARKCLTTGERNAFLKAAEHVDREDRTLCMTLAYPGCRLSEALQLAVDRIDLAAGTLVFKSLKKRRSGIYFELVLDPRQGDGLGHWLFPGRRV